eukprot:10035324-Alexandrium_andersonii.AAC.1
MALHGLPRISLQLRPFNSPECARQSSPPRLFVVPSGCRAGGRGEARAPGQRQCGGERLQDTHSTHQCLCAAYPAPVHTAVFVHSTLQCPWGARWGAP